MKKINNKVPDFASAVNFKFFDDWKKSIESVGGLEGDQCRAPAPVKLLGTTLRQVIQYKYNLKTGNTIFRSPNNKRKTSSQFRFIFKTV